MQVLLREDVGLHHLLHLLLSEFALLALFDEFLFVFFLDSLVHFLLSGFVYGELLLTTLRYNFVLSLRATRTIIFVLFLVLNDSYILWQLLADLPELADLLLQHFSWIALLFFFFFILFSCGLVNHDVAHHLE